MKTLTSKERDLIDKLIEKQNELTTLKLINWSASDRKKKIDEEIKPLLEIANKIKSL